MGGHFFLLERFAKQPSPEQTIGLLTLYRDYKSVGMWKTLELPWNDNRVNESCIPEGEYEVVHRVSNRFGLHLHVTNVPGRELILIHVGNYYTQTDGCILPGIEFSDINGDGKLDVVSSRLALNQILRKVKEAPIPLLVTRE